MFIHQLFTVCNNLMAFISFLRNVQYRQIERKRTVKPLIDNYASILYFFKASYTAGVRRRNVGSVESNEDDETLDSSQEKQLWKPLKPSVVLFIVVHELNVSITNLDFLVHPNSSCCARATSTQKTPFMYLKGRFVNI